VDEARNHQSVDWASYFKSIRVECPWSHSAYKKGLIDIVEWKGQCLALGHYEARVYVISASEQEVEALASALDHGEDEWLFSYPKYGEYATPVKVLIQQNRARLSQLRTELESSEITTFNGI
jgi:hypothetical protein